MLKKLERILLLLVMFVAMAAIPISTAWSGQSNCILQFEGDLFSANVSSARLIDVLEELKKNKGIWFKGNPVMLETEASAQFENLPLEEGVRKILARFNYNLVFDKNKQIAGISILGRSDAAPVPPGPDPQGKPSSPKEPPSPKLPALPKGSAAAVDKEMFKVIPNMPPPGNPNAKTIDTTVILNSPPPENPKAEPIDLTVIQNVPPPGVPPVGADVPKTPDDMLKGK